MFNGLFVNRAVALDQIVFGEVRLARYAIEAAVLIELNVTVVVTGLQKLLHAGAVAWFGGANEIVVADVEFLPRISKKWSNRIGEFLWCHTCGISGLLNFQAVLIGAGQEVDLVASHAVPAGKGIADNGGVSVAKVRLGIDVIDRRRGIKAL